MKPSAQEKLFNTAAMTSTRRMSALDLARLRKEQPHLFKYGNSEPTAPPAETVEFNLPNEQRLLAKLHMLLARCPICGTTPELRRVTGNSPLSLVPIIGYQVCCSNASQPFDPQGRCPQEPMPNPPARSSQDAVRIWSLAVKLAQDL